MQKLISCFYNIVKRNLDANIDDTSIMSEKFGNNTNNTDIRLPNRVNWADKCRLSVINKDGLDETNIKVGVKLDQVDKSEANKANIKADKIIGIKAVASTNNCVDSGIKLTD